MTVETSYTCVFCGGPVKNLYRRYSATVLKLVDCDICKKAADKYVEYDPIIILIDIVLFNRQAYRHVLCNTKFENHWKVALLLLLVKSYYEWTFHKNMLSKSSYFQRDGNFFSEDLFYFCCIVTAVGQLAFSVLVILSVFLHWTFVSYSKPPNCGLLLIWKALVCSSFGHILLLPSLIWDDVGIQIHLFFIFCYTLINQIQSLSVVCRTSSLNIALSLIFASVSEVLIHKYFYKFYGTLNWK